MGHIIITSRALISLFLTDRKLLTFTVQQVICNTKDVAYSEPKCNEKKR